MNQNEIIKLIGDQRAYFAAGNTRPVANRLDALRKLRDGLKAMENEINEALKADLGKSVSESYMCETGMVLSELSYMLKHTRRYARKKRVLSPLAQFASSSYQLPCPYGVTLVMSPWNYPLMLALDPAIDAIAAGNTVVIKPSAYAPKTSEVLEKLISTYLPRELCAVVTGGRAENACLLDCEFDYIFFTGGVTVGKMVMEKAAAHLTPVTLELGGKSPCIIDETADIPLAARRVTWGKFVNAGQTCVAPDYVLCHPSVADEFIMEVERNIRELYGSDPIGNGELCRIVNERHFDRLSNLIAGGEVAIGGDCSREVLKIEPTVLRNVTWEDPVMQEEIFGPIMPVMVWDGDFSDILTQIENRPRPLAAYLFTTSSARKKQFMQQLRFGGGCINDVLCHLATGSLPFGGVGESGMGAYHGRYSFNTFTHEKGVLVKSNRVDIPVRYAPYKGKLRLLRLLSRYLP